MNIYDSYKIIAEALQVLKLLYSFFSQTRKQKDCL